VALTDECELVRLRGTFQVEQEPLSVEPSRISCQAAIAANDPMAWNYDADRIAPICQSDGTDRRAISNLISELGIRSRLPVRDSAKKPPDFFLEICALKRKWEREYSALPVEIFP